MKKTSLLDTPLVEPAVLELLKLEPAGRQYMADAKRLAKLRLRDATRPDLECAARIHQFASGVAFRTEG